MLSGYRPEPVTAWTLRRSAGPITVTFAWLPSLGAVALVVVLTLTSVSIVVFFARTRLEASVLMTRVAPSMAILGFWVVTYLALTYYDALLGGQGTKAAWLLVASPAFAGAGFVWATMRPTVNFEAELV